jgi:spermidine synthase
MPLGDVQRDKSPSSTAACALAFVTAATTLFCQVLVHRMVSAKLVNNYAFLVISLTMLGFALSGVILTAYRTRVLARFQDSVLVFSTLFAVAIILASWFFYRAHEAAEYSALGRPAAVVSLLRTFPLALPYTLPFLFLGLILGTLLTAPGLPTRRIYCFDLVGSSLGAILVIPVISSIGVERGVLSSCLALPIASWALFPPRSPLVRWCALGVLLITLGCLLDTDRIFVMRYPVGSMLSDDSGGKGPAEFQVEHVEWDPVARIEVSRTLPPYPNDHAYPCLTGGDPHFLSLFQKAITQNNFAFTYAVNYSGNRDDLKGIEETIYAAAYPAISVPHPRVLVIGVGGGFDVLNALYFGASHVTGVEVNAATIHILTKAFKDYFKGWVQDPRVTLVNAEGRNYLARSQEVYDVIQLSGVDSYSGTPAAAHVFSENYLYTAEAFDLYLSKLSQDGILNVMRLEYHPPRDMLRALATAVESLRRVGVKRPKDHIAVLSSTLQNFTAILVKRTPFTESETSRLKTWVDSRAYFGLSAGEGAPGADTVYQFFLNLQDPARERAFLDNYPFDVHPSRDDWPFFFRTSYWWHLFPSDPKIWGSVPILEYSIIILLGLVSLGVLCCVYVPLWFMGSPRLFEGSRFRYAVYCATIAIGYLAVEVALLQKFGLLLGHPNYALSVVLSSLLFASGAGSLLSANLLRLFRNIRFLTYALAFLIMAEWAFAFPLLPNLGVRLGFAARAAVVWILVSPIGVLLGVFFPTLLETLKSSTPSFVPWAWGINGIFSVLAPIASVGFSTTWGINALLIGSIPFYLLAALSLPGTDSALPP